MNARTTPQHKGGRMFQSFGRWPLVPTQDLMNLRTALLDCVDVAGADVARELFGLVDDELRRRRGGTWGSVGATGIEGGA